MQLIPYPEYKDSGVLWLGKIPAHWPEKRAKYYFKEVDERSQTGGEEMLSVSHITGVTPRSQKNVTMFKAESNVGQKLCQPGDLVINTMWAWMSALGVSNHAGIVSPAYGVYRPRANQDFDSYYLDHLLRIEGYRSEYICRSTGIRSSRLRLYPDKFLSMRVVCPPLDEQQTIAQFLKAQDRLFRKFIRNKRRLIALLKEQKQNIINQVVTRGLDPNAKFKPSGVEWIGAIPEHWEVRRLKFLATKFGSGVTPRGGATVYEKHGIPFLRSQNVHFDGLKLEDVAYISKEIHAEMRGTHVLPRDVLLNITGASIGRTCSVPEIFGEANVNQHVCIIRPKINKITSGYLSKFLSVPIVQQEILFEQNGASREGLTLDAIKSIWIVIPPFTEQQDIIQHLQEKSTEIDQAITRAQREIELMREYRTRLIADVVTGQVDVRGIEVPEVAEESEADASSPLHDEDTAEADDLLDADGEVEAGE